MPGGGRGARLDAREVIILDGAIGTELQRLDVPLSRDAWAAVALETHPFTVRRLHELYIEAGVDVITVNTYSSARHNLDPLAPFADAVGEFTPPIFGPAEIAQFDTLALPGPGFGLAVVASVLIGIALWHHRKAYKPLIEQASHAA